MIFARKKAYFPTSLFVFHASAKRQNLDFLLANLISIFLSRSLFSFFSFFIKFIGDFVAHFIVFLLNGIVAG